jgi:4-amino-4-deoxy-L-arabinose transferase-like glycosyltransferase
MPIKISYRLLLLLWAIPLLFLQSSSQSLLAYDEAYYATQARWITEGHNWFAMQWWGTPVYDRAIGLQWLISLSFKFWGISEITARLPNVIASLLAIFLTYEIGRQLFRSSRIALISACLLPLMPLWITNSRVIGQDVPLTLIELLGIWTLLQIRERPWFGLLAGATLGLGFCLKSFMIALFPLALLPYIWEQKLWKNWQIYVGIGLGSILPIMWLWASWQHYGALPFIQMFGKLIHLKGTDSKLYNPDNSWFYYLWNVPANTLPWSPLAITGGILIWKKRTLFPSISLLLGYPLVLVGLINLFPTRMPYYAVQIVPFLSLWTGYALEQLGGKKWLSFCVSGLGLIIFGVGGILGTGFVPVSNQVQPYIWLVIITGIGWMGLYLVKLREIWKFGVMIPVWLAIAYSGSMGYLSDRSPEFKAAFQQTEVAHIVTNQVINFVISADLDPADPTVWQNPDHPAWLLLSFYTPHLGQQVRAIANLKQNSYAWVSPHIADQPTAAITSIRGWSLVNVE